MTRSKDHKDEENLRGQLREKDKIIRALKKHIRRLEKEKRQDQREQEEREDDYVVEEPIPLLPTCPKCKRGAIAFTDLGIKILKSCVQCGYRKIEEK